MTMTLAYQLVRHPYRIKVRRTPKAIGTATSSSPSLSSSKPCTILVLHGLLGSGKNLRTFSKRLMARVASQLQVEGGRGEEGGREGKIKSTNDYQYRDLQALLLDLRGHGNSTLPIANGHGHGHGHGNGTGIQGASEFQMPLPHNVMNCGLDVIQTIQQIKKQQQQQQLKQQQEKEKEEEEKEEKGGSGDGDDDDAFVTDPEVVVSHSFGGKVALAYLEHLTLASRSTSSDSSNLNHASILELPKVTWIMDTLPGNLENTTSKNEDKTKESNDEKEVSTGTSVGEVVAALEKIGPGPFDSNSQVVHKLHNELNISLPIAQWMTTNLRRGRPSNRNTTSSVATGEEVHEEENSNKLYWMFDLNIIKELFQSYLETDFWPFLRSNPEHTGFKTLKEIPNEKAKENGKNMQVNIIRAGKNKAWTDERLKEFPKFGGPSTPNLNLNLHLMKNVSHWMHADDPDGVCDIIAPNIVENVL